MERQLRFRLLAAEKIKEVVTKKEIVDSKEPLDSILRAVERKLTRLIRIQLKIMVRTLERDKMSLIIFNKPVVMNMPMKLLSTHSCFLRLNQKLEVMLLLEKIQIFLQVLLLLQILNLLTK